MIVCLKHWLSWSYKYKDSVNVKERQVSFTIMMNVLSQFLFLNIMKMLYLCFSNYFLLNFFTFALVTQIINYIILEEGILTKVTYYMEVKVMLRVTKPGGPTPHWFQL